MKDFLRFLKVAIPYRVYVFLTILFNLISTFFALFSIAMAIPFLGILFETQPLVESAPPLSFDADVIKENFYYVLSQVIVRHGEARALIIICMVVLGASLIKNASRYTANFFMAALRMNVSRDVRNRLYTKIINLHLGFFTESKKGDIISRMSGDITEVEVSVLASLVMIFREPITVIVFLIALINISPSLTLFIVVLLPVSGFVIGRIGKNIRKASKKGQQQLGGVLSVLEETLSGLRIIKAFNGENFSLKRFMGANQNYTRTLIRVIRKRDLAAPLSEFLGTIVLLITMIYGGSRILNGQFDLSPEAFIGYMLIFSQIINPAKNISNISFTVRKGMAAIDRMNEILKAKNKIVEVDKPLHFEGFKSSIEYSNVSFSYNNSEIVLKNINVEIKKGQTIALVGESGSGKSTLVDLLPRLYDVEHGKILIDGHDIKHMKLQDLRHLMGIVNQDPILFNDTIYNNIAYGDENINKNDIEEAAKIANAHDFILETENGYQTNVGDRGSKLSGGQRQRISIARAILKNPPILILDEATSALDTESERYVQEAITKLMQNRTSIVIAHRLSTIRNADEIIVLNRGEIVERGNHEDLLAHEGYYKRYHELQNYS
jgi:subfamily B ATP-binding cassette protein MsbA